MGFASVYAGTALAEKRNDNDMVKIASPPGLTVICCHSITPGCKGFRFLARWWCYAEIDGERVV
jgi:hypothetical protein